MRAENDRHHALDAVVVACSTVAMQQKITHFVRYKEMNAFDGKTIDKETGEVLHQKHISRNLGNFSHKKS